MGQNSNFWGFKMRHIKKLIIDMSLKYDRMVHNMHNFSGIILVWFRWILLILLWFAAKTQWNIWYVQEIKITAPLGCGFYHCSGFALTVQLTKIPVDDLKNTNCFISVLCRLLRWLQYTRPIHFIFTRLMNFSHNMSWCLYAPGHSGCI